MLGAGYRRVQAAAMPAVSGEPHSLDLGSVAVRCPLSKPSKRSAVNDVTTLMNFLTNRNGFLGLFLRDF